MVEQAHRQLLPLRETITNVRRGKVEPYTGENPDMLWEEWLPMFERAASWNG